jgi:hypothetical protein
MSDQKPPLFEQELREKSEPTENVRAVPYVLILLMGAIASWAFINIFNTHSQETSSTHSRI